MFAAGDLGTKHGCSLDTHTHTVFSPATPSTATFGRSSLRRHLRGAGRCRPGGGGQCARLAAAGGFGWLQGGERAKGGMPWNLPRGMNEQAVVVLWMMNTDHCFFLVEKEKTMGNVQDLSKEYLSKGSLDDVTEYLDREQNDCADLLKNALGALPTNASDHDPIHVREQWTGVETAILPLLATNVCESEPQLAKQAGALIHGVIGGLEGCQTAFDELGPQITAALNSVGGEDRLLGLMHRCRQKDCYFQQDFDWSAPRTGLPSFSTRRGAADTIGL